MGAQIRVYRQKIASTSSMKKIFKAMEMIATSRINKARNAAQAAGPYANALTRVVTAVATQHGIKHPLIHKPHELGTYEHRRSAILVVTSDRGLAGSYSSAILRRTESLIERLRSNGQEVQLYLVGRKAKAYFEFRERPYARAWEGHTDAPRVETAVEIRDAAARSLRPALRRGRRGRTAHRIHRVQVDGCSGTQDPAPAAHPRG